MINVLLAVGIVVCAIQCIRAPRLLASVLWLAGVGALLSIVIFGLGAAEVAVVELSVGAGLVTVLFVFAVGIAGELTRDLPSLIPKPLAWLLTVLVALVLGWFVWPAPTVLSPAAEAGFAAVLWQERTLDVWLQVVFLFAGVLGILGLLAEAQTPVEEAQPEVENEPTTPITQKAHRAWTR